MNNETLNKKDPKFDELYNQIYSETYKELEESVQPFKEKIKRIIIIFLVIDLFMLFINPPIIFMSIPIVLIILLMMYKKNTKEYRHLYKDKVLQRFIHLYNKNLTYYPSRGITYDLYKEAEFEKCDKYSYGDLITGNVDGYKIRMAQIITELVRIGSKGETQYTSVFQGFFAVSTFENNFDGFIKVRSDQGKILNAFHNKNKLEMDSQEFENYFDVISSNNIQTMQVLTPDVMNMLLKFEQEHNIRVELTIKKHKIFIRFHCKKFFKTPIFSLLDYDILLRDYNIINFTFDITRELIKTTAKTKI